MMTMRFGWALAASLAMHVVALIPAPWWLPREPAPLPPLAVHLPPPEAARELATQPEMLEKPADAVPPTPTSALADRPRELKGRALDSAMAALAREEFYPREAIERGWEGRVVLLLAIDAAGRVTGIEVASSSGHAILDDAALRAATRITALPGGRRQVLLPVEFRLE
ncbi:MAG: TonB family protein [Pseudomonadota bacterium]